MKKTELFFASILLPIDIAMIIVAFAVAYYLRVDLEVGSLYSASESLAEYLKYIYYLIPFWILLFAVNGLYYIRGNSNFANEFYRIILGSSTAILLLIVGIFLSHTTFFSRLILILAWGLSICLISLARLTLRSIRQFLYRYGVGRRNMIIIGDNQTSRDLYRDLSQKSFMGYKIIGLVATDKKENQSNMKSLGSIDELTQIIKDHNIDEVVLTDMELSKKKVLDIIKDCSDFNATFKYIPEMFSLLSFKLNAGLLGSTPILELKPNPLEGWGRIVKRACDILISGFFLLLLSPIMLLVMLLVKLTSKGPIFYGHDRISRYGNSFKCYKFRSMYTDKCDYVAGGEKWTTQADDKDRVTPLGRFLRRSYLDELPQLWNIFVGQMSFVGPRPEQPKFVDKFTDEIPGYFKRHNVKTGLTGWAQVNGLKGDTSIAERVKFDVYYIENWSLLFDIKIIIKTIWLAIYETFFGKYEYRSNTRVDN